MANDTINLSSASASSVVKSEKGGHKAAQLLSETATAAASTLIETAGVTSVPGDGSRVTAGKEARDTIATAARESNELEKQAQKLQELSQLKGWAVSFSVDNDLNKTVIRVVDSETQKTIRQIPSEELLTISKRIQELRDGDDSKTALAGLLFDRQI